MRQVSFAVIAVIGGILMLCFCGAGLACSVGFAPLLSDEADKIENLPTTTDVRAGTEVALTGTLSDNPAITSDPDVPNIGSYEVVAYQVETAQTSTSRSGGRTRTSLRWETDRTVVNTLTMEVEGRAVTFVGEEGITLNGDMLTFNEDGTQSAGSKRVRGFRNGDLVTIVATRTSSGDFSASQLYGGTRDGLVSDTRTVSAIMRYAGYCLLGIGAAIGLGLLVAGYFLLRTRPSGDTPAAAGA